MPSIIPKVYDAFIRTYQTVIGLIRNHCPSWLKRQWSKPKQSILWYHITQERRVYCVSIHWWLERYGRNLDAFWPAVDTEIERLGIMMANEGSYPENARAPWP